MTFGENLQFLRKRGGLTQEDLAEKMEVSRQSVSKWESNAAYPEMDAILRLCDLFGVDMDTLLRGDVSRRFMEDTAGYDRHMNAFSKAIAGGVGLILLGLAVYMLILLLIPDQQKGPIIGTSILLICIATAVTTFISFGMGHNRFKKKHPTLQPFYTEEQIDAFERRFPFFVALPTALIFVGIVCQVSVQFLYPDGPLPANWPLLGTFILLLCITVAVTVLVWAGIQKGKYNIEEYNRRTRQELDPTPEKKRLNRLIGAVWGTGMVLAAALHLLLGFIRELWTSASVIYPVAALLCVAVTIFLKRNDG